MCRVSHISSFQQRASLEFCWRVSCTLMFNNFTKRIDRRQIILLVGTACIWRPLNTVCQATFCVVHIVLMNAIFINTSLCICQRASHRREIFSFLKYQYQIRMICIQTLSVSQCRALCLSWGACCRQTNPISFWSHCVAYLNSYLQQSYGMGLHLFW